MTTYTEENETIYQNLNLKFHGYHYKDFNLERSQNTHIVYMAGVSIQGVDKMVI